MKVILNADIDTLGRKGEIVEVASGYARNFLLPRKLALAATKGATKQAEAMSKAREERDRIEREKFQELVTQIESKRLTLAARVGAEGQLFGSVTAQDLADELSKVLGEEIDRRKVEIPSPIRTAGTHEFTVQLHRDVAARATVEVVPDAAPTPAPEKKLS